MAGEVYASISGLDGLNESLRQTLPMLDRLVADNEATMAQATQKIERILDSWKARANSAYQRYQIALTELNWAIRDESVSEYHYSAVTSAAAEYDRLIQNCSRIKAIYSDYTFRMAAYKRSLSADFEDYSTLLKKSDSFLSRYAELLRRSQRAIEGDAGGSSSPSTPSATQKTLVANDGKTAPSIQSVISWLGKVNPNYTGSAYSPYSVNCGSCAFAIESRLSGANTDAVASATNIGLDSEMEQATGKRCVYMPVQDIEKHLMDQGAGSHLIVGINRKTTPSGKPQAGHWFNAYYDGQNIFTIDGQSGEVYDWPHDYGDISEWCALV
jgi:hypothetical protein